MTDFFSFPYFVPPLFFVKNEREGGRANNAFAYERCFVLFLGRV